MKSYPFLIDADASGESLNAIDNRERAYHELWLQELLRRHPDILPVAEIEPVFYPLVKAGLDRGLVEPYHAQLRDILLVPQHRKELA